MLATVLKKRFSITTAKITIMFADGKKKCGEELNAELHTQFIGLLVFRTKTRNKRPTGQIWLMGHHLTI